MTFPVEGWRSSAAVVMRQRGDAVTSEVHGAEKADAERAWQQALATVSLDVDGQGFVDIGRRDPIIGRLQAEYGKLRPVLFHSPYEAACAFVIGHRISILQTRRIRQRMAEQAGATIEVDGTAFPAFPTPGELLRLRVFRAWRRRRSSACTTSRALPSRGHWIEHGSGRCPRRRP